MAIVRVEQLYPFPSEALAEALAPLPAGARGRLGPGGAGEHGRVALRLRAQLTRRACRRSPLGYVAPARGGEPRDRAPRRAHELEQRAHRRGDRSRSRSAPPVGEPSMSMSSTSRARRVDHRGRDRRVAEEAGDAVAADEPVVVLETDKVTVDVPAPAAGVLAEDRSSEGDDGEGRRGDRARSTERRRRAAGAAPATRLATGRGRPRRREPAPAPAAARSRRRARRAVAAARRPIAQERGIAAGGDAGAPAHGGRILKEDVLRHARAARPEAAPRGRAGSGSAPAPVARAPGPAPDGDREERSCR